MKTLVLNIFLLVFAINFTSCKDKAKEAETTEAEEAAVAELTAITYKADTENSTIEWKGFKPTGSHFGTIKINEGELNVNNKIIESGNFTIAMGSIVVEDLEDEKENADLTGHLTSEDFFDVETYPNTTFEVTGIETIDGKTMLSGNLTMKDATNNVKFPIQTEINDDMMTLTSETFTIDRSKWNVKYGSKSFFDGLGDKFINDEIELKIKLVAKKA